MINIMGVVILYHPDTNLLFDHINTYLPGVNKLLLYDNSELPSPELVQMVGLQDSPKLEYIYFGKNEGISKRLNMAAEYAIANGYEFLLTMDQDSAFEKDGFDNYLEKINRNTIAGVAQYGVNCQPDITPATTTPEKVISLITSGSILDLKLFTQVGPFDEKLFIDFVDAEFSYRVVDKGFVNVLFSDIILLHRIGYLKMGRSLKNWKLTPRLLHAPVRVYYILRNGLYLWFRVPYIKGEARKHLSGSMKILKNDFIYHENPGVVYSNAGMAIFDFIRNKMGKK